MSIFTLSKLPLPDIPSAPHKERLNVCNVIVGRVTRSTVIVNLNIWQSVCIQREASIAPGHVSASRTDVGVYVAAGDVVMSFRQDNEQLRAILR